MSRTADEVVKEGADFLDTELPGWDARISLERLVMSDGAACILGQQRSERSQGNYMHVIDELNLNPTQAVHLGYLSVEGMPESVPIAELDKAWRKLRIARGNRATMPCDQSNQQGDS